MNEREYMDTNRAHWDEVTPIHVASAFYDVSAFKGGRTSLDAVERAEVGDVRGKTLLHLQCHFGMDTLSWAREGAVVTGVDYSEPAIAQARALGEELGIDARFVVSNVYDLPGAIDGQFDVVFTSYGALCWLPDIAAWARVAAGFVKPGGFFYIAEFHPVSMVFDDAPEIDDLRVRYPYFPAEAPLRFDDWGDYTDRSVGLNNRTTYEFLHPVGDVVSALCDAGLRIDFLHEFPFSTFQFLPITERRPDGSVRLTKHDGCVPLLYSIKATKPA
ncbi:MAG TPA: class I SAM-dependent methyltransferase [Dehalococcoidia bacterium]|nr:class I SAM-dependent methyltransferase [Dehalococcoidia bacterium]